MIRNFLFYAIASCGALALANLVWAQPVPGKVGPPLPIGNVGKINRGNSVPMDLKKSDVIVNPVGKLPGPKFDPVDKFKKVDPKIDPIDKFKKVDPKVD